MSKVRYGLDCSYYTETFETLEQLWDHVLQVGMDPSCKIRTVRDGKSTIECQTLWEIFKGTV